VYVSDRLVTVDRVTKTLVVADNKRYRRKDGYECGQHMWLNWLRIPTDAEITQLQERDNQKHRKYRADELTEGRWVVPNMDLNGVMLSVWSTREAAEAKGEE